MDNRLAELKQIIKDTKSLPTLPGIISKLSSLADDSAASVHEIARVVSSDQVLSAKILKLVNSPFYGFPGRVSTVSNALILLGVNVVKSLALSSSIFEIMERHTVGLWEHSLGVAAAANLIARRLQLPEPDEIATAALLHDIGKVIIKIKLEQEYDRLQTLVRERDVTMREAEQTILDADHAEIGALLGKAWYLPEKLIEPIAFHHAVEQSGVHQIKTAVVHIADALVKADGFGFSGDDVVPPVQPHAWKKLGLDHAVLEEIIRALEGKLVEIRNFSLEIQASDAGQA